MSTFLNYTEIDKMSLSALVEMAGQISALLSYVQLIDTPQDALARRVVPYQYDEVVTCSRRSDDLQRNALGRKRRHKENGKE